MWTELLAQHGHGMLPQTFRFLYLGWWIVHLVAIPLVFVLGFLVGRKAARPAASQEPAQQ